MLDFQVVQAPLRFGLAEGVDPHQVPFGTLVTAENAVWSKSGRLEKRLGSSALATGIVGGGSVAAVKRLVVRGNELALSDGTNLYSLTSGGWQSRGRHPELGLDWTTSTDAIKGVQAADSVVLANGQIVEAWVTGDPTTTSTGALYYQIRDLASGTVIRAPSELAFNNVRPTLRLVAAGNTWVLISMTSSGALQYTVDNGVATTTGNLQTDAIHTAFAALDACVLGTDFVVAYTLAAGGIEVRRYSIATTPVLAASAAVAGTASTGIQSISVGGAVGETLYVGFWDTTPVSTNPSFFFAAHNPSTMASTVSSTLVEATATGFHGTVSLVRETATTCLFVYSFTNNLQLHGVTKNASITNAGVITTGQSNFCLRQLTRPFLIGGRFYIVASPAIGFAVVSTSDTLLADVTSGAGSGSPSFDPFRQVGKIDVNIGGRWVDGYVSNPSVQSSTVTCLAVPFASTLASPNAGVRQGVRCVRALSGASCPADMWRPLQLGPEAYLCAGVFTSYDGVDPIGYGWPYPPYIDTGATAASTTGGSMVAGTYQYNVTAERRSAVGVLHRSPAGIQTAVVVAVAGAASVTLGVSAPSLGHDPTIVLRGQFVFYRSVVGGTIPQRIGVEPNHDIIVDSQLSSPATTLDTYADAAIADGETLASRPALYIAGGELEDNQPPSCLTGTIHKNRLWLLAGDGRTLWFSKDYTANVGTAPGFHPTQILQFDRALSAVGSMDDKLMVFASDTFWFVVGDGPVPTGQNSDYQVARVQTDVGCTNPRSLVSTPDGLMFLSSRGLYLLTRDLGLAWIGRPVKDQLAAFPNVTSAVLVASRNEVRFTCNDAGGTASIVLVYNYVEKQWTTARYTVGGVYGAPIADAVLWNGVWTFATPSGFVVTETSSSYLDGAAWVPLTLETAWISATGPLAYQSVRNFAAEGVANTNHDLTVSCGFDNEAAYAQTATFVAGSDVTKVSLLEQFEISIGPRRKCRSIRFKIQDATPTNPGSFPVGTGQGPSFDMLGIEVGMKKGFKRVAPTQAA